MEKAIELGVFNRTYGHRVKNSVSEPIKPSDFDRDKYELARVGKEQVLKVSYSRPTVFESADIAASFWLGVHDRPVVRTHVHMGKHSSVRVLRSPPVFWHILTIRSVFAIGFNKYVELTLAHFIMR